MIFRVVYHRGVRYLGALMVLSLLVAADGQGATASTAAGTKVPLRVALVLTSLRDSWNAQFAEFCRDYAVAQGVDLALFGCNREGEVELQESLVDTVVAEGFRGMILLPADSVRLIKSCRSAVAQGVALVVVVNPLDPDELAGAGLIVPFVGCDDTAAGKLLGAFARTRFPSAGKGLVLETADGNRAARKRVEGFLQEFGGLPNSGQTTRMIAYGQRDDAFLATARAIAEQRPDLLFAANDEMAMGAADAAVEHGHAPSILLLGIGNTDQAKARMRAGQMQASVDLRSDLIARAAVSAIQLRLTGKAAPGAVQIAPELITADSVGKHVSLLLQNQADPFAAALATGAKRQAERHGLLLQTMDAGNDSALQEKQLHAIATTKCDFLIVDPLDLIGTRLELQAAMNRGVRVIMIRDSRAEGLAATTVGIDYENAGKLAGDVLARLLNGKGAVVELEGIPETAIAKALSLGVRQATSNASGIRWISRQSAYYDRGKARSVVTRWLENNPSVNAFFAHDPAMLLGAAESCRAKVQRARPVFVGFGYSPDAAQAVRQGELSALVYASGERWGETCIATAIRFCRDAPASLPFVPVELSVLEY